MATLTFQYASFGDGAVTVDFDVNDSNWRVSRVRCINNSAHAAVARVLEGGTEVFTAVAPAGQTTSWNVSGIQLGWQPDYWNEITQQWERDGIDLRGYQLQTRWPA